MKSGGSARATCAHETFSCRRGHAWYCDGCGAAWASVVPPCGGPVADPTNQRAGWTRRAGPPRRVRRLRTKGWRKPEGCVIVDRSSRYGNPFRIGMHVHLDNRITLEADRSLVVALFRRYAELAVAHDQMDLRPLRGKDLACTCPLDQPCHADVLLELANR